MITCTHQSPQVIMIPAIQTCKFLGEVVGEEMEKLTHADCMHPLASQPGCTSLSRLDRLDSARLSWQQARPSQHAFATDNALVFHRVDDRVLTSLYQGSVQGDEATSALLRSGH